MTVVDVTLEALLGGTIPVVEDGGIQCIYTASNGFKGNIVDEDTSTDKYKDRILQAAQRIKLVIDSENSE